MSAFDSAERIAERYVAEVRAAMHRHRQKCPCAKCECPVKLTIPSEWIDDLCIFCSDGNHTPAGGRR